MLKYGFGVAVAAETTALAAVLGAGVGAKTDALGVGVKIGEGCLATEVLGLELDMK